MSKQHGILFKGEMVRAILEGRKTMTRRLVKPQPEAPRAIYNEDECSAVIGLNGTSTMLRFCWKTDRYAHLPNGKVYSDGGFWTHKAKYSVGDLLYVKETFQYTDQSINVVPGPVYRATDPDWETMEGWKWKPSIFMPKKVARIWLEVTDVKVERVCDISHEDSIKEGIQWSGTKLFAYANAAGAFYDLWKSINGEETWSHWCFAYTFKRIEKPDGI